MLRTEAIKKFLLDHTHRDLAEAYNFNMEVQVNVAKDDGDVYQGEYKGHHWRGWTDGVEIWKSFRIPYKANSEPEYVDREMTFDLAKHAEGIGMTGWDWVNKVSRWVAFDFDALISHSSGLTPEEIAEIKEAASSLPWVTVRYSTSGNGLHIYVPVNKVPTATHTEHAALARAILGYMSAETGYNFNNKVDICGGNMWVWHRKMVGTKNGLAVIKHAVTVIDIPENWQDHIPVILGRRRKTPLVGKEEEETIDDLINRRHYIKFDAEHKRLIQWLKENDAKWWYDQDRHLIVTHTTHLKDAFKELGLKGVFDTISTGKEKGHDHNCFMFPLNNGAWVVRRFTPGVQEHKTWFQDQGGWTTCYLNREPDLPIAARLFNGLEDPKGGFVFPTAKEAKEALALLGLSNLPIGPHQLGRATVIKPHKDGRLIIEVDHQPTDRGEDMEGWLFKNKKWVRVLPITVQPANQPDLGLTNHDDVVRHLIINGSDAGWVININGEWIDEPRCNIKDVLASLGYSAKDITSILGSSVLKAWQVVNLPFQPEYPGGRKWNRNAARFRVPPSQEFDNPHFEMWERIFKHCGQSLDEAISNDDWCKSNGIYSGGDYLKMWVSLAIRDPFEPLPYLFFFGPQDSGKSIFHEALHLLIQRGIYRADLALTSTSGFNAEIEPAIICVIEELDLRKNTIAYNRIKDWVTSREIVIHRKGFTPYTIPNATHWIHCANDPSACPIFPGDTRITMCHVPKPVNPIPKKELLQRLEKQASDFLAELLGLPFPSSHGRMNLPVIETMDKDILAVKNENPVETFINEYCKPAPGYKILFSDFYSRFMRWATGDEAQTWGKIKVSRNLPAHIIKGRSKNDNQVYIANLTWLNEHVEERKPYSIRGGYLV